jgi:hypothetical protein
MHPFTTLRRGALLAGLPLIAQVALCGPAQAAPAHGWKRGVRVPAEIAATAPQSFLAGLTSQQQPVLVRFSADGGAVARALTTLHFSCTSGDAFFQPDEFRNLRVSSLRHFRASFSAPPQTVDPTTSIVLSGSIAGQVDKARTRVSGTWRETAELRDPATNAATDTCTSGVISFSVHR